MTETLNFEQSLYSRTVEGILKIGLASIRLVKRLTYHDRSSHEKINFMI